MHPLAQHRIPGVGAMRLSRLEEAGFHTLEDLIATDVHEVASLPGFHLPLAIRVREAALVLLQSARVPPPPPVEVSPPKQEPAPRTPISPVLRRGLEVARRVEDTRSWIRKVRAQIKPIKRRARLLPLRQELRLSLKRLIKTLDKVQREAITHGLTAEVALDVDALLAKIERRLERFSERELQAKRITRLGKRIDRYRKELRSRLT